MKFQYPYDASVRLGDADGRKLAELCWSTERPPSEVLRAIIRLADTDRVAQALAPRPLGPYRSLRWFRHAGGGNGADGEGAQAVVAADADEDGQA